MPAKSPTTGASDPIEFALEKEVRELVARYGRERVREVVLRQTKAKLGRRPRKDWHILAPIIEDDALQLLDGIDPFSARTNYSIASEYAANEPGHSHTATVERIERKLRKYRKPLALADAASRGSEIGPHHAYLRMLEQWREVVPELAFDARLEKAREILASFEIKFGSAAPLSLSISEIGTANAFSFGPLSEFHAASNERKLLIALNRLAGEDKAREGTGSGAEGH